MDKQPTLFQFGDFTLNSGAKSRWKIECDALTDDDWKGLAELVCQTCWPFSEVVGVPRGGLKLASSINWLLEERAWPDIYQPVFEDGKPVGSEVSPVLIVDDVLTTGGSMDRLRYKLAEERDERLSRFVGAVVFARGPCPSWIKAVFQMPKCLWLPTTPIKG